MAEFDHLNFDFIDNRGFIKDLIVEQNLDAVTLINSEAYVSRGMHFHKESTQWTIPITGVLDITTIRVDAESLDPLFGSLVNEQVRPFEVHVSKPYVAHMVTTRKEPVTFLICSKGPRAGFNYEADTFRVPEWFQNK